MKASCRGLWRSGATPTSGCLQIHLSSSVTATDGHRHNAVQKRVSDAVRVDNSLLFMELRPDSGLDIKDCSSCPEFSTTPEHVSYHPYEG